MEYIEGMIVKSKAGHDGGSYYVITRLENGFAFIADGRERKVAKPKKKNVRHLERTASTLDISGLTDKKLRALLHELNFGQPHVTEESD